jgi:hypothetical protein
MATQRSSKRLSALKKSRKFRDLSRQESRRLHLEQLEDRRVMAVFVLPNNGELLNNGDTRTIAPQDLTFRFTDIPGLDSTTIANGIQLRRAGGDGQFGQANDVVVTPGFIGLGDNSREVVMRFAETLPDDTYQITIFGAGATPLRDTAGNPINSGANQTLDFRLDLGAQVIAIVPQPVRRLANGTLAMNEVNPANPATTRSTQNMVYVYFNDDKLDPASATNREFYRLYVTKNTLDPSDDTEVTPGIVEYDEANNLVRLIFDQVASLDQLAPFNPSTGIKDPIGSLRLRIGTSEALRNSGSPTVTQRLTSDPGSSFATAFDLGSSITNGSQGASATVAQAIEAQTYSLVWPGAIQEPGHREIPAERHLNAGADGTAGVTTRFYNFQSVIGTIPDGIGGSQPAFNLITENQKQRAREIFDLYSRYSGIQFIESANQGITVATADPRVINPMVNPDDIGGIASGNLAIVDSNDTWNDSYGGNWFEVAMHEIGHVLGLGHSYDLPPLTVQGDDAGLGVGPEPVFPGDHDIVHMRHLYRPESKDIDMYRFTLDGTGVLRLEAFAERLPNSSSLDTTLRLYRIGAGGAMEEIARNDDYFSKDSKIELTLGPGTYFVGVTASGNDQYDPTIVDSGIGGTTQGAYELKLDFRKSATQSIVDRTLTTGLIPDTQKVAFDGDADGVPGGVHNFWFRAAPLSIQTGRARTIFVDKVAPNGGNGLISSPYNNIQTAMAAATEFDVVRIVGNGGADGDLATLGDNRAYQIGFGGASGSTPLVDGTELAVPKNVTVMIDAGAIFQMRRSHIVVGSTAPSLFSDRSGGALQVLGTPTHSVYFTSFNELGPNSVGLDQNPFNVPPAAGDWGGLYFKNDLDTADGRFDHEAVGVFLNYVNHADIRFGGGQVNVDSLSQVVTPINILDRRPTVSFNTISNSANAAMSANPDSFEETNFQAPRFWPTFSNVVGYNPSGIGAAAASRSFTLDYDRVGPDIHGNTLVNNSTNALFVRTRTPAGNVLEELTVAGRFDDTDIVHVLEENLSVRGTPSGPTLEQAPPPVELVFITEQFGLGNYSAGTTIEYKLTFVDAHGNESLASTSFFANTTVPNAAILMEQLQEVPSPQYVARKLYRRTSATGPLATQPFRLVDQIPASVTQYLDRNLPTSGNVQELRVLSTSITRPRLDAGLVIDPSIIVKSDGARIDVGNGANLIAEGFAGQEVVFTSLADDRYGAGSSFDTNNDSPRLPASPTVATTRQGSATQNELQTVTLVGTPVAGAFTLTFNGQTSGAIAYNATAAALQTALEGLGNIAPGDVLVSKTGNVWTIEFRGTYANQNVTQLTANIAAIGSPALAGDWGGIFFSPDSQGSVDNAVFAYAGGLNRIEGTFAGFNTIEIHQADVRITQSKFEFNEDGQGGQAPADRFGRGFNSPGTIFVRGAQPVIMDNIGIFNAGAFININVNALNHEKVVDLGRQSGLIEREPGQLDNNGPLVLRNRLRDNELHGMVVRGGTLTTESVWDDTDIVHILFNQVVIPDFHTFGGLRLESSPTESLVVKSSGATAGITATGRPLEIDDRIGGMLHILGQPGVPVVLTGLSDDTEGAGVTPEGLPQYDTDGNGNGTGGGGGGLPTGPEVNNGTIIDNDVDPNTVGFFRFQPGPGGSVSFSIPNSLSGVTAQGQTQLLIDQDFIFDFLNYVDIGANGGAIDLSTTTITQAPTLVSDDLVVSQGTFAGANGPVNWRVETRIDDGISIVYNTLILNSASPFGSLRFVNYLDEDVINLTQNLLYQVGSPGQADFRLYTLDNGERIGFSQGGVYAGGPDLVNATYDGWAADAYSDLVTAIEGPGTTYLPTGNIDTTDLTPFVDPALGNVHGLADVTTAMAWTVDPTATTARITTFLELIPQAPVDTGNPGEWQGITIDQWAHDRNVETILELESGDGSINSTPSRAQLLGGLGPFEKGGDENLRLGFTVHGVVVNPSDVDVYSFQGRSGTEVWIDLDRTTHALDAVIELIDNNGNVLARSNNSVAESAGLESRTGLARAMQKTPPYEGVDYYTTNPRDGGMRVLLPGPTNTTNTYFVRVRSNTGTVSVLDVRDGGQMLVTEVVAGSASANERQRVTLPVGVSGSTFTLTFNGQTTAPISMAADSSAVQAALVNLSNINPADVTVTGGSGQPWDVVFGGQYANQPVPALIGRYNEFQQLSIVGNPSGGSFTLTFGGQTTGQIPYNATAAQVQAALVALSNVEPADVLVTGGNGGPWTVEYRGAYSGFNLPLITANSAGLTGNQTSGSYQLQVRLREVDEFGGTTVRFAKIANAVNGIHVIGQPTHSPLSGEAGETNDGANNAFGSSQFIGNLLNTDRGVLSVAGSMSALGDVDWYSLDINYDATQGIPGVSTLEDWWSTVFDIDYADGLARPNLSINVFDANGNLVLSSRDSNVADDRPNPLNAADSSDLSRGSSGAADPWIGNVELPQGRYFVAISTDSFMPQVFDQYTNPNTATPFVRLEPLNTVQRIVEDRGPGTDTGTTGTPPVVVDFIPQNAFVPWSLHDVTMYVSRDTSGAPTFGTNQTQVLAVDPFSGITEYTVGSFGREVGDVVLHPNGSMFAYTVRADTGGGARFSDAQTGNYLQIDTGTGAATQIGDDGIETYMQDPANAQPAAVRANDIGNNNRVGEGVHFRAMEIASFPGNAFNGGIAGLAIGGRDELNANGSDAPNILYVFDPNTGAASGVNSPNRTGTGLLPGPNDGPPAGTQIVERAVLNTDVDAIPSGAANLLQILQEATFVDPITGATTFQIMDNYPAFGRPPEIPFANPDPTTFSITYGGPATVFEFDAGPEAIFEVNPNSLSGFISDGQGFLINGTTLVEFDTGEVLSIQTGAVGGSFADGTTLTIVSPDANGGAATTTTIFEFDNNSTVTAGNIPISTLGRNTNTLMAQAIRDAINSQGLTTIASIVPGTTRITLANNVAAFPGILPLDDTDADHTATGMVIVGAAGAAANSVRVRIEETSVQSELAPAFALVNASGNLPLNTQVGVNGAIGVGRMQIGFDGNRLNVSGATTIANGGGATALRVGVFQAAGSQGGVIAIPAGRVSVPFLAEDTAADLATRMAAAINAQFNPPAPAFGQGSSVIAPNGSFTAADTPLQAAAQAPGGTITGMTAVQDFDDDGNVVSTNVYVVTDNGGLYRLTGSPFGTGVQLDYINTATELVGIEFSGLDVGPANVEGNRYREMMFATTEDGMLYVFNEQGTLQPIFSSAPDPITGQIEARSSMQLQNAAGQALTNVHGVAFSTLDRNIWGNGGRRPLNVDPGEGHGIHPVVDDSRVRPADGGSSTVRFGGYNQPGGAHGTIESATFSLAGYSAADQPTFYFNYFMESEGVSSAPGAPNIRMRDALRVSIAGEDGVWHLLTTNNSYRGGGGSDDEFDYAPSRIQETFDNPNSWRQARVSLAEFAGQDNLQIRFDFSTGGSLNVGGITVGDELRAVEGAALRDGQSFQLSLQSGTSEGATEPNNTIATAVQTNFAINGGFATTGNIGNSGQGGLDVDMYRLDLLAGQSIDLEIIADQTGSTLDSILRVFNAAGVQLAVDDDGGVGLDSFLTFVAPAAGAYYVGVSSFSNFNYDPTISGSGANGNSTGPYQFRASLTGGGVGDGRFEFDLGYTLVAPSGATIPDGAQFSVQGATFTMTRGAAGAGLIPYTVNDSSAIIAQRIANAITGLTPIQINGNRLNLRGGTPGNVTGATLVSGGTMPAGFVEGAPGVAAGNIAVPVHAGMSREEQTGVAEAIALAMATEYASNAFNPREQIKSHRNVINLIGYRWIGQDAGPNADSINQQLLGITLNLPGDEFGAFNSNQRAQNNTHEGIYLDDFIIGFAERGEMASGPGVNNQTFIANPTASETNISSGEYQLEVRRAAEGGIPNGNTDSPRLELLPSINTNDRLGQARTLVAPAANQLADGQFFTLSDGVNQVTFEFNDLATGTGVAQGRIGINFSANETADLIAQRIRAAINSAPVQSVLKVTAGLADGVLTNASTSNHVNLYGSVSVPNAGGLAFTVYAEQYGDRNHFRDQGQIILQGNEIVNSSEWGILIDAAPRNTADGNLPHPGSVRNLQELNTQRLLPGVVVMNNTIYNSGTGGIRFSGDPAADAAVPFGRIVNNTLYGQGGTLSSTAIVDTGIQVDQNAAPTILNNIVANFTTGINVDGSSQGSNRTVLGGTVYQGNGNDSNIGLGGSFPIVVPNSQPLFVNPNVGNFYPAFGSPAIDSSVDSLLDRPALVTVRNPLGILQSPILSPDRDGVGQLRVDDPSVNTPQGFGLNPFKDRGAIDRVDFVGPTSLLISPPDNDAEGTDLDPSPTTVVRANDILREFRIQLIDRFDVNAPPEGSDIDDFTVTADKVVVEVLDGPDAGILQQGIHYSFSYDATNNTIILNPLGGIWPLGRTYRIYLDNSITGIRDQAGNPLLPNQADGISHYYTIFLGSAVDWGDAPASYGVLGADDPPGPSHTLNPNIRLGASAGAEADGQPSANADADSGDDGLLAYVLSRGALSSITIEASAVGFVHVWVDLDQNGTFDTEEYLVQGATFDTPGEAAIFDLGILPDGGQGDSFMRIRFTTGTIDSPLGPAPDGEVEDHLVQITGPAYHNGNPNTVPADVDNNGVVNILDLLHVVNFITYLESKLINAGDVLTVPPTSPPYRADDLPDFDPSGGGVPGAARYIDVSDQNFGPSGYGQINLNDLLAVVNTIREIFDPGDGEGEASLVDGPEGEASPTFMPTTFATTSVASSSSGRASDSSRYDSATLYAAGNITLEVRERTVAPQVDTVWDTNSDDDDLVALMAVGQAASVDLDDESLALDRHLNRQSPMGPLDAESWESLLSDLAQDVGGLPDDDLLT